MNGSVTYVRTCSRILFILKKEILYYVTTWMNLKDLMLREMSQSHTKNKYCVIPLMCGTYNS